MLSSFRNIAPETKAYRRMMAKAAMLPENYQVTFGKIQGYLQKFAVLDNDELMRVQREILKQFEEGAARGRKPVDITGWDFVSFTNALLQQTRAAADLGNAA